jgi:uroporphyrinogen-III synthase
MRVIVTRPEADARRWVRCLAQSGIDAFALPLLQIRPVTDVGDVQDAWRVIGEFQSVMFVSAAAVDHFFAARTHSDTGCGSDAGPRFWATGSGTVAALVRQGVEPARIDAPEPDSGQFDSEALWRVVADRVRLGWRVLVVRGSGHDVTRVADPSQRKSTDGAETAGDNRGQGRDWLAAQLAEAGAQVRFVVAYWRAAPAPDVIRQVLAEEDLRDDVLWLFTSSEAIGNLKISLPGHDWSRARALATHPRIAAAARAAGFGVVRASRPGLADIAASIKSL